MASSGVSRAKVAVEQHHPVGSANVRTPIGRPNSQTNAWMSYGFFKAKNEQELDLQQQARDFYRQFPQEGTAVQLEHIYRALSFLSAMAQFRQSRETPGQFRGYCMCLNLFGQAQGGAMDQILPYNVNRKRITLYATGTSAFVSNKVIQTINPGGSTGSTPSFTGFAPLQIEDYMFLPEEERWHIDTNAAVYGVGISTDVFCILSVMEELFNAPTNMPRQYRQHREQDANIIKKANEWTEDIGVESAGGQPR